MTTGHDISIHGSEPRSEEERRNREYFLAYLDAVLHEEKMQSQFTQDFWPHDLIPGPHRPPLGIGLEAMRGFREVINGAFTTVRSMSLTWIDDDTELSELAGGAAPGDLAGARLVVVYVHDGRPVTLPGSARAYEATGKDVTVEVADVARFNRDGRTTDRWNQISIPDLIRQLEENLRSV